MVGDGTSTKKYNVRFALINVKTSGLRMYPICFIDNNKQELELIGHYGEFVLI